MTGRDKRTASLNMSQRERLRQSTERIDALDDPAFETLSQLVEWIALNDEPTLRSRGEIAEQVTVQLVCDVFNLDPQHVAAIIVDRRTNPDAWGL